MVMDFKNKVVIVTGGGQGIGETIALNFAKLGADVAVFDLNLDTASAVANKIKAMGRKALAIKCDVASSAQVNQAVAQVVKEMGTVDILVNNAGFVNAAPSFFTKETEDYWRKIVDVCYFGVLYCCKAVLDIMIAKKSGKIVSIASDAGRVGQSGQAVYSGAKAAVIGFSKAIAKENARYMINVNCVAPGATATPAFMQMPPEMRQKIADSYLFKRVASTQDVANAVAFLASDEASYITGQVLSVSSGYTMIG